MVQDTEGTTDRPSVKRGRGRPPKGSSPPKPQEKELAPVRHGLYCDPRKVKLDGRSKLARLRCKLQAAFLEGFDSTPSPRVQALAEGAAVNWIVLTALRNAFLRGEVVAPSVWKDFCAIQNCLDRSLTTLEAMAKEGKEGAKTPTLAEYLEAIRSGRLQAVEPGKSEEGEG